MSSNTPTQHSVSGAFIQVVSLIPYFYFFISLDRARHCLTSSFRLPSFHSHLLISLISALSNRCRSIRFFVSLEPTCFLSLSLTSAHRILLPTLRASDVCEAALHGGATRSSRRLWSPLDVLHAYIFISFFKFSFNLSNWFQFLFMYAGHGSSGRTASGYEMRVGTPARSDENKT